MSEVLIGTSRPGHHEVAGHHGFPERVMAR